mmetsp:Transcript_44726/g.52410  ORF Transcript_44726/g.52410 Transcript_44726/m.52410 type:complete len:309 (+) Transcript_44726:521-1447(+)|eukprot:CAMPEP_0194368638 /NCGR_PEP_ID=MMETSP0174-20130528/16828_1 /TAXON_ID=216777 /ORGANISM="Proboscia alata, Strain PI-D3" /LENGTH=308 /DNA_ID=CAMNT_0039145067 /DNA_START=218 /DNA_END=1144 /DNA_ORIENTATION=+
MVGSKKQVVGRLTKLVSVEKAGLRRAPPCLVATFGIVHLREGSNVFHCPTYFPEFQPSLPAPYHPTENQSPFFFTQDGSNHWMYRVNKDLKLLKLYRDGPLHPLSMCSRTCLKADAYKVLFDSEPKIPLHSWRGNTSQERDSLVEGIFALGHDGFISTGDNTYDDSVEVCIHRTGLLSHVPRESDDQVKSLALISMADTVAKMAQSSAGIGDEVRAEIHKTCAHSVAAMTLLCFEDELLSSDGSWTLPKKLMQEEIVEQYLSQSQLPSSLLPTHERLQEAVSSVFLEIAKLDSASQKEKIEVELLKPQ